MRNPRVGLVYDRSPGQPPFLSSAECDAVVRSIKGLKWTRTQDVSETGENIRCHKKLVVGQADRSQEINRMRARLRDFVTELNAQVWRFHVSRLSDVYLFRYDVGDQVTMHTDLDSERKLAIFVQLSPADAYEGGDLELGFSPAMPANRAQGSALIFPTWVLHRVTSVTQGTRYSAACFALGPSFR